MLNDATLIISSHQRDVWTTDERKVLDRAAKLFNVHGDRMLLRCGNPVCPEPEIALAADRTSAGGAVLRCGCRDRFFVSAH